MGFFADNKMKGTALLFFCERSVLGLAVLLFFSADALAYNVSCNEFISPDVTAEFSYGDIIYDRSHNFSQLTAMMSDEKKVYKETVVGGLYRGLSAVKMSGKMRAKPMADGSVCAGYDSINVNYEIIPEIFIASEYPQGSCSYREVMAHELKHHATAKFVQKNFLPITRKYLENYVRSIGTQKFKNKDEAAAKLQSDVSAYAGGLYASLFEVLRRRQEEIDNPDEYYRVSIGCNGDTMRIVKKYVMEKRADK